MHVRFVTVCSSLLSVLLLLKLGWEMSNNSQITQKDCQEFHHLADKQETH